MNHISPIFQTGSKIRKYSLSNLRKMQDDDFEDFKNSLDDKLFSAADRASFHRRIDELRARQTGQPTAESRFLGMFVEKLLVAHQDVKERERPLRSFISLVTKYLRPRKLVTFDGHNIVIKSTVDSNDTVQLDKLPTVQLDKLSSGEKQVVSIFAYLFLSGQKNFLLMIDEPELSLSVPWQKRFLPDLIDTGSCAHIISVTHSPFVFDNDLKSSVVDVRRLRVAGDE
ncbi:ATP-binding protein [Gluconobacter wancherniae]|uniref:AAA family ATPase n=1 Tax=Gluconobacter wancherniae TaxID=1307955 RepID=UPI001B8C4E82|nr:AAA family ATPase [Gluconobacter wancherniae]MBS1063657.1 ATP-binding protein [Gluconobacter wancherniae]